jgi:adenosylcobinamide kinase/adenosylcobinamide-phosphate guanylyltransferase
MKTLVLGGVKSGKSRYAEKRLQERIQAGQLADDHIAVIVTGQALDPAMAERIARHQQQRPAGWCVIEAPLDLPEAILAAQTHAQIIMIDCLTLWLTNLLMQEDMPKLHAALDQFIKVVAACPVDLIIVSNETNMGIMPLGQLTRDYCDHIGNLHQGLAEVCSEVVLVVAGLPLHLKKLDAEQQGNH